MRQNDCGLASIAWTIAARMTDAWVTATVFPRIPFCASSHAATRSCFWIAHPFRKRFGLLRLHLVERAPAPSPIIAFAQHRLDDCVELQGLSGLNGPQRRAAPASIRVAQAMLDNSQLFPPLRVQLLVRRERRCSNGRGRCVANQP
jgi:hypothetical protein